MPALKRLTERFLPDDVLPFFAEIRSIVRYSADRLSHSRRLFLAVVLMKAAAFGLGVYVVFLSKLALDKGIMAKDMGGFLRFTLSGLLVFAVLKGLLYASESILEKLRAGFSRELNSDMTERFLGTDYLSVRTLSSSENSFLALYDQENIESLVFAELRSLAALVKVPVYFVMAFLISPLLTLVVLLALPFMLFNTLWISGGRKRHRGRELYFTRKHQAALQDVFLNFKLIKSMGKEAWAGNRLTEYFGKKQVKALSKGLFILRVNTLTGLVTKAATALYWILGGYLMIQKGLSFGSFSAVSIYTGMVLSDISGLGSFLEDLYSERRSIERCASFARDMTGGKNVSRRRSGKVSGPPAGDIVFHDVSFAYPGRGRVIDRVSFVLPAGEWSWIRGASGVGKTTLLGMLLRLFPPDRGRITMGGQDVGDIDRRFFYRTVSPVHQDPFILNDTILNNILMGDTVEKGELEHVLEFCGVSELVRGFPLGYNTRVGEFGNALSGGQKQRIAIARGLIRRPGVLVLDEATSFIDADSEKAILKAIKDDFPGMTVVLVTHRDSVGEFTDLDLVMSDRTMTSEVSSG